MLETGQNKNRGPTVIREKEKILCPKLANVAIFEEVPSCDGENCQFLHDINAYLSSKPEDISDDCYMFQTHGYCPRGVTCRYTIFLSISYKAFLIAFLNEIVIIFSFGKSHTSEEGKTIRNNSSYRESSRNFLSKDVQYSLRKRSYDFSKSDKILLNSDRNKKTTQKSDADTSPQEPMIGYCADNDLITLKADEKKKVSNFFEVLKCVEDNYRLTLYVFTDRVEE